MVQKKLDKTKCPRCTKGPLITIQETNETCCSKCGLVVEQKPEERTSSGSRAVEESQTGIPTSLAMHDHGLSTKIGQADRDATGKALSSEMRYTMKRLKVWDSRTKNTPVDRNFIHAFGELSRLSDRLSLSKATIEDAAYIYRKALESKLVRGRSINAVVAASVYAACRNSGMTRNLKDLEVAANIKRKDIARCYRMIVKNLELKMNVVDPINCISRISSLINTQESTKRYAIKVLEQARKKDEVAGKDPMGLAAASLYLACIKLGEDKTQRVIAEAAGVTEVTIRNRFKGLKDLGLANIKVKVEA
jgi:transcription initiation factor TFIIB